MTLKITLAFIALHAQFSPQVFAQSPISPPTIQLIWMGGNDYPPCVAWRKDELPKLQKSDEFKGVTFSYVTKVIRSTVPASFFLPPEVKPYKDKLDYASSGRGGSPQAAVIVNGEVFDYFHKTRSAAEIEAMLLAVRNNTKYPFERCLKASTEWGKCEIRG
jgi:hypothetical protein